MLVHQRAVAKHHSVPQIGAGFTEGHVQEHLQNEDRDIDTMWIILNRQTTSLCLASSHFSHLNQLWNWLKVVDREQNSLQSF